MSTEYCGNCGTKMDLSISDNCPVCGQKSMAALNAEKEKEKLLTSIVVWIIIIGTILIILYFIWLALPNILPMNSITRI